MLGSVGSQLGVYQFGSIPVFGVVEPPVDEDDLFAVQLIGTAGTVLVMSGSLGIDLVLSGTMSGPLVLAGSAGSTLDVDGSVGSDVVLPGSVQ